MNVVVLRRSVSAARRDRRRRSARLATTLMTLTLVLLGMTSTRAADRNALWEIVHGRCVPDQQKRDNPAPCAEVDLHDGIEQGSAVLKDLRGKTQFLLIPTARISGIEDPELLASGSPNYFADAWQARTYVDARAGRTLPRESISLAINSMFARSQNQLHIHVDCIRADVRDALHEHQAQIGEKWALLDVPLSGHRYRAMRVMGEQLGQADPFKLLADGESGAREDMGRHTLVVAGETFADGKPGFIVLDDSADRAAGDWGSGEELQDHGCALAHGGSAESSASSHGQD